jgi:hypothetical protein
MDKFKLGAISAIVSLGALLPVTHVFAVDPTPTIYPVDAIASQVGVNVAGSVTTAITDLITLMAPYGLKLGLIFLGIGVAIGLFQRFRHAV